jgi:hypothetical protein
LARTSSIAAADVFTKSAAFFRCAIDAPNASSAARSRASACRTCWMPLSGLLVNASMVRVTAAVSEAMNCASGPVEVAADSAAGLAVTFSSEEICRASSSAAPSRNTLRAAANLAASAAMRSARCAIGAPPAEASLSRFGSVCCHSR